MRMFMSASSTGVVVMETGPPVRVRLPTGGWQVGFRTRPDGRAVVEVTKTDGALSILSITAGWAGWTRGPGGDRWW